MAKQTRGIRVDDETWADAQIAAKKRMFPSVTAYLLYLLCRDLIELGLLEDPMAHATKPRSAFHGVSQETGKADFAELGKAAAEEVVESARPKAKRKTK